MNKDYSVHPGSIMKHIVMSMGKSQAWLAESMNMSKSSISLLLNQKRSVSKEIAEAFQKATGYSSELLLKHQEEYDLYQKRIIK